MLQMGLLQMYGIKLVQVKEEIKKTLEQERPINFKYFWIRIH